MCMSHRITSDKISPSKNLSPHSPTNWRENIICMITINNDATRRVDKNPISKKKMEEEEANENSVVICAPQHTAIQLYRINR